MQRWSLCNIAANTTLPFLFCFSFAWSPSSSNFAAYIIPPPPLPISYSRLRIVTLYMLERQKTSRICCWPCLPSICDLPHLSLTSSTKQILFAAALVLRRSLINSLPEAVVTEHRVPDEDCPFTFGKPMVTDSIWVNKAAYALYFMCVIDVSVNLSTPPIPNVDPSSVGIIYTRH